MDYARRVVRATVRAVEGEARSGLDTACGTGAFLLAMAPHLMWLHQTGYTTFAYVDTNKADSLARLGHAGLTPAG